MQRGGCKPDQSALYIKRARSVWDCKADTAYGTIQTDSTQIKTAAENIQQALYAFSYEKLNVKNRITYDLLKQYLRNLREEADYLYYEEPLNISQWSTDADSNCII